uniref:Secreted protein n=1 Tax=Anguilla anguilla TaxID=7936 RepID=A0A0E9XHB7_ANGAN
MIVSLLGTTLHALCCVCLCVPSGKKVRVCSTTLKRGNPRRENTSWIFQSALPSTGVGSPCLEHLDHGFPGLPHSDPLDGYTDVVLHKADVVLRFRWEVIPLPGSCGIAFPARKFLILHLHFVQYIHVSWEVGNSFAVKFIGHAHFDFIQHIQNVQFR